MKTTNETEFLKSLNQGGIEAYYRLHQIALDSKAEEALEIGSGYGIGCCAFLFETPIKKVITIDKIPDLSRYGFDDRVKIMGVADRIERIIGDSTEVLPSKPEWKGRFGLIYVDGNHQYEGVKTDIINSLECLRDDGVMILDDFLHKSNWEGRYGIPHALYDVLKTTKLKVELFGDANGVATIKKI